jgi:hypothetical protein
MFSKSKLAAAALAAFVLAGTLIATAGQAQAHRFHGGWGWGGGWGWHGYGHGCRWKPKFNYFGDYVGSVRICRW